MVPCTANNSPISSPPSSVMAKKQKRIARKKKENEERQGRPVNVKGKTNDTLPAASRGGSRSRSRLRGNIPPKKSKRDKKPKVGLFVTKELAIAIETTKSTVERIAKECRSKNKRFRFARLHLDSTSALTHFGDQRQRLRLRIRQVPVLAWIL